MKHNFYVRREKNVNTFFEFVFRSRQSTVDLERKQKNALVLMWLQWSWNKVEEYMNVYTNAIYKFQFPSASTENEWKQGTEKRETKKRAQEIFFLLYHWFLWVSLYTSLIRCGFSAIDFPFSSPLLCSDFEVKKLKMQWISFLKAIPFYRGAPSSRRFLRSCFLRFCVWIKRKHFL